MRSMVAVTSLAFRRRESNRPPAVEVAGENLTVKTRAIALEEDLSTGLELLPGMHQGLPLFRIPNAHIPNAQLANAQRLDSRTSNQQTLDRAATRHAVSEQTRREDARIIQHQKITAIEMGRELLDGRVLPRTGRATDDDEARCAALGRRMLSDQLLREIEIELAEVHDPKKRPRSVRPRLPRIGFHRSPTLAIRRRTLSSLKSSMCAPFSTSFHASGVDTVARGLGRTE